MPIIRFLLSQLTSARLQSPHHLAFLNSDGCHSAYAMQHRRFNASTLLLRGLDFCYAYIDDVLIASHTPEEHKAHLHLVLQHFDQYGILINPAKCMFGVSELHFLGHYVTSSGVSPLLTQVKKIRDFPQPNTLRKLLVNFYHRFIPRCATIMTPLNVA